MSELEHIHSKIASIEKNMAMKSDIAHFEGRMGAIDNLAEKLDGFTSTVTELVIQGERRIEADKHKDKESERIIKITEKNQQDIQLIKQKDAEKAPYYKMMERGLLALASAMALGLAYLVFK